MDKFIEFIGNNYNWFLTISIVLLFALIGYIYDTKRNKNDLFKKSEQELDEESLENIVVPEGKNLSDMIAKSKNINPETQNVELTDASILNNNIPNNNLNNNVQEMAQQIPESETKNLNNSN